MIHAKKDKPPVHKEKKIRRTSPDGDVVIFNNTFEASKEMSVTMPTINKYIKNGKSPSGYTWDLEGKVDIEGWPDVEGQPDYVLSKVGFIINAISI